MISLTENERKRNASKWSAVGILFPLRPHIEKISRK